MSVEYFDDLPPDYKGLSTRSARHLLETTVTYRQHWLERCEYEGAHASLVGRSALVLKLLTYAPTGAVIAEPTTSLPEELGGVRN